MQHPQADLRLPIFTRTWMALATVSALLGQHVGAYSPQRDTVTLDFYAPPVVAQLVDSAGRRCGVDFSRTISAVGIGTQVQEMEHAMIFGFNLENDNPDSPGFEKPQLKTNWQCSIFDRGEVEYDLLVRGLGTVSQSTIEVGILREKPGPLPLEFTLQIPVMVSGDDEIRIRISVTSATRAIEAARISTPNQLKRQVALGCRLGLIAPGGACKSLSAKADAIAKSAAAGRPQAMRGAVGAFLNELQAQGGKHVHEPALTVLREEAESLATPPRPLVKPKRGASKPLAKSKLP